jgi:hypothetical protein
MRKRIRAAAMAAALGSALPASAQSFQDCTYDCRAAYESALASCAGGRTAEIVRACRARAAAVRERCANRCNARENQRLRLEQARQREAEQRRRLRQQH